MQILGITNVGLKEAVKVNSLYDFFPIISKDAIKRELMESEGGVILYEENEAQVDASSEDYLLDGGGLKPATTKGKNLLWAKIVVEKYGGVEKGYAMLFAEILEECKSKYKRTS